MDETYTKIDENTMRITRTTTQTEDTTIIGLRIARERKQAQIDKLLADHAINLMLLQGQLDAIDAQLIEAGKLGVIERTAEEIK